MPFLDLLIALPGAPIRLPIFKKVLQIFVHSGLIVFGNDRIVALKLSDPTTKFPLGMERIHRENAACDQSGSQQGFESADLILLLAHLTVREHQTCMYFIETEQMDSFFGACRRANRLAIDSNMRFVLASCLYEQARRLVCTPTLTLPPGKKGC